MAKKHSSEAFYALDDPLEAVVLLLAEFEPKISIFGYLNEKRDESGCIIAKGRD